MKRDFDLIRSIMLIIEAAPANSQLNGSYFQSDAHDPDTVLCHVNLLIESGLINGNMSKVMSGFKDCRVNGLTWSGYEFLDAARDESIWNKAKDKLLKPAVALTFEILKDWLKDQAQAALKGL